MDTEIFIIAVHFTNNLGLSQEKRKAKQNESNGREGCEQGGGKGTEKTPLGISQYIPKPERNRTEAQEGDRKPAWVITVSAFPKYTE